MADFQIDEEERKKIEAIFNPEAAAAREKEEQAKKKDDLEEFEEELLESPDDSDDISVDSDFSAGEDKPLRDFFIMLVMIPISPLVFVITLLMRKQQSIYVISSLSMLVLILVTYFTFSSVNMQYINNMTLTKLTEDIPPEEVEILKSTTSTLKESIGLEKLPMQLQPLYDIQQDMLSINYYYYLINAGYMGNNAEGAVIALQSGLYSANKQLKEACWESLKLIDTDNAKKVLIQYQQDMEEVAEKAREAIDKKVNSSYSKPFSQKFSSGLEQIKNSLK